MASGTVSFQSNDKSDVFHVAQITEDGIEPSDEVVLKVEDTQFDGDKAWVTGRVPKMRSVNVEGDTTIINAWFRAQAFDKPFTVRVYVECELTEELEQVTADEGLRADGSKNNDDLCLEPIEIHL